MQPLPRTVRAVAFDLDGTLLDAYASHYRVYTRLFADLRVPFDETRFRRSYSPNWYAMYGRLGLAQDRWPDADRLWLRYYAEEAPHPRDGAVEVLAALEASGRRLGVVTSGDRSRVERDLMRMGWTEYFGVVVCGADVETRKPAPEPLRHALRHLRVDGERALYVGDAVDDVHMARAAGVRVAAITGGFASEEALRAAHPDFLVADLRDLLALVELSDVSEPGPVPKDRR